MAKKIVKSKRTFKRKRTFKKKVKHYPSLVSLNPRMPRGMLGGYNDISPFPTTLKTKLVYTGQGQLTSSAGSTVTGAQVDFRLNGAYDPYTGLTGPFNNGCFQYAQLLSALGPYKRYKVNGALVELLIFDSAGTDSDANEVVVMLTSPAEPDDIAGVLPYDAEKVPNCKVIRLANSGSQRRTMKQYVPMSQAFQWTKEQYRTDKTTSTAPYNDYPASQVLLKIALANARAAATATTIMLRVKITYYVECYERVNPTW